MARRNDGKLFEVWIAKWSWRDGPVPTEYVFSVSQPECLRQLEARLVIAKRVLKSLGFVGDYAQAGSYLKVGKPRILNLFDVQTRESIEKLIPDLQADGVVIWSEPWYIDMAAAAGVSIDAKK